MPYGSVTSQMVKVANITKLTESSSRINISASVWANPINTVTAYILYNANIFFKFYRNDYSKSYVTAAGTVAVFFCVENNKNNLKIKEEKQ